MDPRDLINKGMTIDGLKSMDPTLILNKQINSAIDEMRMGKIEGGKAQRSLIDRFRDNNGRFDKFACMRAVEGKVANPRAFCNVLSKKS